jgi:hypothetical protein
MEEEPVRFLVRELEARLDEARQALGAFIGADPLHSWRGANPADSPPADAAESSRSLREKVVKIGAKVIAQGRYAIFQTAEVAVPRELFGRILERIARLRPPDPAPC